MDRHFWSSPWAADRCSISQQIIHVSQKLRIPHCTDKSLTHEPMPNHIHQIASSHPVPFFKAILITTYERNRGSIPARGERFFFSSKHQNLFWDPPNILCFGYQNFFLRQQSGHGLKLMLQTPPSTYSKNVWNYTSIPPYAMMASCLIRHWENGETQIL